MTKDELAALVREFFAAEFEVGRTHRQWSRVRYGSNPKVSDEREHAAAKRANAALLDVKRRLKAAVGIDPTPTPARPERVE